MSATVSKTVLNPTGHIRIKASENNESQSASFSGRINCLDIQSSVINEWLKRHSSKDEASMARKDEHVRTMICMSPWG